MDTVIASAARALATGDALRALNQVALRDEAPALALRGIAMAQLGDLARAKVLLRRAARAFGARETVARARCVVAEAEVALVSRDLRWPAKALDAARATLAAHGDQANAAYAALLEVRRLVLLGRLDDAEHALAGFDATPLAPASAAVHALVVAALAMRRLRASVARDALERARRAAQRSRIAALVAEVDLACAALDMPAARLAGTRGDRPLRLEEVETLLASKAVIVDACRHDVRGAGSVIPLAGRPVLFALARALGEAWPNDVSRDALVARAFRAKRADDSYRARLRVEIGRLRKLLRSVADVKATRQGFVLLPRPAREGGEVVVLAHPVEEAHAPVLVLLADGESWSSSALALALGVSQRSVQRALDALAAAGKVRPLGAGRARRWVTPLGPEFATTLLLSNPVVTDQALKSHA